MSIFDKPEFDRDAESAIAAAAGTTALPFFDRLKVEIKNFAIRLARSHDERALAAETEKTKAEALNRQLEATIANLRRELLDERASHAAAINARKDSDELRKLAEQKCDVMAEFERLGSLAKSTLHQIMMRPNDAKRLATDALADLNENWPESRPGKLFVPRSVRGLRALR